MATKDPLAKVFYVYALIDPRNGEPFYIGKGKGRRKESHVREWFKRYRPGNPRKNAVITEIHQAGMQVEAAIICDGLTEAQAYRLERREIMSRANLTNVALVYGPCMTKTERDLAECNSLIAKIKGHDQWRRDYAAKHFGSPPSVATEILYWYVVFGLLANRVLLKQELAAEMSA